MALTFKVKPDTFEGTSGSIEYYSNSTVRSFFVYDIQDSNEGSPYAIVNSASFPAILEEHPEQAGMYCKSKRWQTVSNGLRVYCDYFRKQSGVRKSNHAWTSAEPTDTIYDGTNAPQQILVKYWDNKADIGDNSKPMKTQRMILTYFAPRITQVWTNQIWMDNLTETDIDTALSAIGKYNLDTLIEWPPGTTILDDIIVDANHDLGYYDIRIQVTYYPESLLQWGAYVIPSTTDKGMIMSQKNKNDPDQTTAITGSNGWVGKNLQQGEYLNTVLAPLLIED